uniref:NAC domain-containing protein n=1 Tax=Oryza meridionalis TaxID=40149 RepID=A0A0E0F985_9ORYZ
MATLPQMAAAKEHQEAANPTTTTRTLVESVTNWIRVYSDGSVDRLGPPEAAAFMVLVPPYDDPRDGLDVAGIVPVVLPLAPEHRLPAAIDTGHAALLWLRDVACGASDTIVHPAVERLRGAADFSRVFLIGDSAGGVLVHNVAARAGEAGAEALDPIRIAGGVLLHPGFILPEKSPSELENPPTPLPVGTTSRDHPYTSPAAAVTAAEGAQLPPMLVMVAEEDMLLDAQVEYGEAMARAGKAVETVDLITFYLPRLIAGKPTEDTEKFICRADVYGSEPSDLAGKFAPVARCGKGGRFFFTSCKRHKGNNTKKERTAGAGTWVRQNSKGVKNKAGVKVGETQNFRFKKDGSYTDWLMEEHHCCRQQAVAGDEEPVICRMYVSPRAPPDSAARQESAAFVQQQPAPQVSEPPCDKKRDAVAEEAPAAA